MAITQKGALRADLLLLLTAAIWGFAFTAQRVGMAYVGPFTFNAARYLLGALSLLPLVLIRARKAGLAAPSAQDRPAGRLRRLVLYPLVSGTVMFAGASLQQAGIVSTTAGNAAFITSLYVVLVPVLGLLVGRRVGALGWLAVALSVAGLYLISVAGKLQISPGDLLVLLGAFFWALHIIVIDRFAGKTDAIFLSAGQFLVVAVYSVLGALVFDGPQSAPQGLWEGLRIAALPIAYGGILSCGVAFTLQIVAQRHARPTDASIIFALEGLFGALGGIILLGEPLGLRLALGGLLMLGGAILSQLEPGLAARRQASRKGQDKGFARLPGPGALSETPWVSEAVESPGPIAAVTPSWAARSLGGARLRVELRARIDGQWSPWYALGLWSEGAKASIGGQEDGLARVATDTLVLKRPAQALQARASLEGSPGEAASPRLDYLSLAWEGPGALEAYRAGGTSPAKAPPEVLEVPAYSQMLYGRGKGWCSPTCLSMVFAYWEGAGAEGPEAVEKRITRTAEAVWDSDYEGCGNWAFNAAYAASLGYESHVRRFSSLAETEAWIQAGIPVVLSLSWDSETRPLDGAPLPRSGGHLSLLVGFGPAGEPEMNDPAAPDNASVPRSYPRAQLEARWQEASGGIAYLIWPKGRKAPL